MPYHYRTFAIRDSMLEALQRYVATGCHLGDFLRCVVCNDLKGACGHADDDNLRNLPAFVVWLYNEAPALCHGSQEAYVAWLALHDGGRGRNG